MRESDGDYFIKSVIQKLCLYGKIRSCRIDRIDKYLSSWQIRKLKDIKEENPFTMSNSRQGGGLFGSDEKCFTVRFH